MNTNNIYSKDWCNELFEGKNKNYGAYELRLHAGNRTLAGMVAAYALIGSLIAGGIAYEKFYAQPGVIQHETFTSTLVDLTDLFVPPAPAVATPKQEVAMPSTPKAPTNAIVNPIIVSDKKITDDGSDGKVPDELKDNSNTGGTGNNPNNGTGGNNGGGNTTMVYADSVQNSPLRVAEVMPEFPGGINALTQYLSTHVKYPREFADMGITGTVYLSFVVNRQGKVTDVNVLRGVRESKAFENEAVKAVNSMPNWKPGKQSNKEVSVLFTLPVAFKLR